MLMGWMGTGATAKTSLKDCDRPDSISCRPRSDRRVIYDVVLRREADFRPGARGFCPRAVRNCIGPSSASRTAVGLSSHVGRCSWRYADAAGAPLICTALPYWETTAGVAALATTATRAVVLVQRGGADLKRPALPGVSAPVQPVHDIERAEAAQHGRRRAPPSTPPGGEAGRGRVRADSLPRPATRLSGGRPRSGGSVDGLDHTARHYPHPL